MHLRADLQSAVSALGHPPLLLYLASLTSHLLASIPAAPSLYHTLLSLLYLLKNPTFHISRNSTVDRFTPKYIQKIDAKVKQS